MPTPAVARDGRVTPVGAGLASQALVERYLEHVRTQRKLAARTVDLYAHELRRLQTLLAQTNPPLSDLLQVHHVQVRRWVAQLHAQGASARSLALTLSVWRGLFAWMGREGLVPANPVQDLRPPKVKRLLPKALAVDEAVQLAGFRQTPLAKPNACRSADEAAWLELRDHALTELLYSSGLRVGELVALNAVVQASSEAQGQGWVDLDAATVHVCGKGAKWRTVPVGRQALGALQQWLSARAAWLAALPLDSGDGDGRQALFVGRNGTRLTAQSIWQRLRARAQQAGLAAPVHPHMLRHSFASHVLQSSGDLRAVQELLGHASISATQVYTRLDFQHLAKVYDAAHPRAHLAHAGSRAAKPDSDPDAQS